MVKYFSAAVIPSSVKFCILTIGVAPITQYMRVCSKKGNTQGSVTLCGKSDFPYLKELPLKESIHSLWEQIHSFKRSSHFEKGLCCRESLLDTVVSL